MKAASGFNHIAGPYVDGVQLCTVCEGIIVDDRCVSRATTGGPPPRGFPQGPVCVSGNCTAAHHADDLPDCQPRS